MRYATFSGADEQEKRTLVLHGLADRRELGQASVERLIEAGFSPDGRWLALQVARLGKRPDGPGKMYLMEIQLLDPATALLLATVPAPGQIWGNQSWTFSPDGNSLAAWYGTGSNVRRAGDPDPLDRPLTVEIWELPPR